MSILRKPFKYSNFRAVYWLIGINVLVFAIMYFLENRYSVRMLFSGRRLYEIDLITYYFSMNPYFVIENGFVWTFVTYMFVHGGFTHLLFNMFGLFIFGIQVERQMGSREFLLFYFVTGILAGFFSFIFYIVTGQNFVWLVGASGAIYAVMLAYAVLFPGSVLYIWGILPVRAPIMVLGFTAISLFSMFFSRNSNVAHLTHLAGFVFAWLYFPVRFGMNPWRRLRMR